MHRRNFLITASAAASTFLREPNGAEKAAIQAGVARVDLTPPMSMNATLGGYGARMSKPAVGVHDRVWLKCIVLSEGNKRLAIVTADALGFPPPVRATLME